MQTQKDLHSPHPHVLLYNLSPTGRRPRLTDLDLDRPRRPVLQKQCIHAITPLVTNHRLPTSRLILIPFPLRAALAVASSEEPEDQRPVGGQTGGNQINARLDDGPVIECDRHPRAVVEDVAVKEGYAADY